MLFGSGRNCLQEQIPTGLNVSPLSRQGGGGGGGGLSCVAIAVTPATKAPYVGLTPLLRGKCSQEVLQGHLDCHAAKGSAFLVCLGARLAGGSSWT